MSVGKLRLIQYIRGHLDAAIHRLLRPYVGRLMEKMAAEVTFEGECEDDDLPDCDACDQHGHCPFEVGEMYQAPPGFMLVRPGPPPDPRDMN